MKGVNNRAGPSTVTVVAAKPVSSVFRPAPPVMPAAQSILGMLEPQTVFRISQTRLFCISFLLSLAYI
jgi:hypothetical protein